MAHQICENLKNGFYKTASSSPSHLATPPEAVWEELKNKDRLDSEKAAILEELLLFDYPAEGPPYTGYFGDEGGIYPIKQSFPQEMWHIFGVPEAST